MKKRLLSLFLILILCITMLPSAAVSAAEQEKAQPVYELQDVAELGFSNWTIGDLIAGDTYGIYPRSWYDRDMTVPITKGKFKVLMAGVRVKILGSGCVTSSVDSIYRLSTYFTVDTALKTFYDLVSSYTFNPGLALGDGYIEFMKGNGIYTGKNGEQALKDSCSIEQACVIAVRLIHCIYNKLDAASKGFFYKTEANGNTVYMLGSVHVATTDIYPFSDKIIEAFESSDALAVEINVFDQTGGAQQLLELCLYTDGTTLRDHVSEQTYDKVIALAVSMGYSEEVINMFKPWYLYLLFSALAATDSGTAEEASEGAALGIDMSFLINATISDKPILEVEGYASQAAMLDSFSDELEEYILTNVVDAINKLMAGASEGEGSAELDDILTLWRKGDAEAFEKYSSFEYEYREILADEKAADKKALLEEYEDKVLIQRNKKMAEYIENLLTNGGGKTYFVVVGSGHYIGDNSVIDILREKGYVIPQIK